MARFSSLLAFCLLLFSMLLGSAEAQVRAQRGALRSLRAWEEVPRS